VWLDDGEIRQIIRERERKFTDEEIRAAIAERSGVSVPPPGEVDRYPCPRCGKEMEKHDLTGMMVDRCPDRHGLWFDQGEIEKAQIMAEQRQDIFRETGSRSTRGVLAHLISTISEPLDLK
jgi:Zn-finger nucleic acid-binding protein